MSYQLPDNSRMQSTEFVFGVATAAFQIEGANTADGRCESIWDRFCATPGRVLNGDDGAIACDHYHRLEDDLDLIQSLGMDAYRFSVAWPRIEPKPGEWNEAGFAFYERLVDGLIARGIKPYLTLYHWDLPQYLEDKGGWVNRETAYRFAEYAKQVTARLGDKVVSYATFNEPWCSSFLSYQIGEHAPGFKGEHRLAYQAAHHLLLAHGLALPAMRNNAPNAQHGIVLNFSPAYPATDSDADKAALKLADEQNDWFLKPLLTGSYPTLTSETFSSWMPTQMPGDLDIIAQPLDFIGVNFYSRTVIQADSEGNPQGVPPQDPKTDIGWEIYPQALTKLLLDMRSQYGDQLPPILITENGAADNTDIVSGEINDQMRTNYYQQHLRAIHEAMEQGAHVTGYFAWSLMDNFEWAFGYSQRFGIVHVDYSNLTRTIKKSGKHWQAFLKNRADNA